MLFLKLASHMTNTNLIIIDFLNKEYFKYIYNSEDIDSFVIIKYQDCYLPLLKN